MKKLLSAFLVVALSVGACATAPPHTKRAVIRSDIPVSLDPSVSGLAGRVGDIAGTANGQGAWVKFGPNATDWQAFPGNGAITTNSTLTGAGTSGSPLAVNPAVFVPMTDRIALAVGDQQDLDLTGINGDADGDQDCVVDIIYKGGVGAANFYVQPITAGGAQSTNQRIHGFSVAGGSPAGAVNDTTLLIHGESDAADQHIFSHFYLTTKTGRPRQYRARSWRGQTTVPVDYDMMGIWTNTVDNITGIRVHGNVAASMRAASFIKCRSVGNTL